MKKIVLIIISVVMLFSSCENQTANSVEESIQTQIDPDEEFNGITFGMTQDEVITVLDRSPDRSYEFEDNDGYDIQYYSQKFFDVTTYYVAYHFDENGNLYCIWTFYKSYDESEKEQMQVDLDHVKKEIFKYYPEITIDRIDGMDNEPFFSPKAV